MRIDIYKTRKPTQGGLHEVLGYFKNAGNPIKGDTTTLQKQIRSYGCVVSYSKNIQPKARTDSSHKLHPILNTQTIDTELSQQFTELIKNNRFVDAIYAHLPTDETSQERVAPILKRMKRNNLMGKSL